MNSHEVFIHIHQGYFAGTGAIVRLPQCQWSKPDGYGKISQCITTTNHSKAKTVCIFLGIYCICISMVSLSWCDPARYIICVRIYTELKYCKINVPKLSLWAKFSLIITDPRALSHFTNWNQLIGHGFHQRDTWPVVIIYAEIDGFFVDMSNLLLAIVHITIHTSYPHVRRGVQMCWNLL